MLGTVDCSWMDTPWGNLTSADGGISIWYANTADLIHHYDDHYRLLNFNEKNKAQRFYHQADRQRYVIQHGLLRKLLGSHLGKPANDISFNLGPNQKPYLADTEGAFFNLSNSKGYFVIAIGRFEMGVDIEIMKPDIDHFDIAENYFCDDEIAFIKDSQDPAQAFYLLWTRKEALLKACGMGIDDDLPNVPALDGTHNLPARYPVKEWQTKTFMVDSRVMISITIAEGAVPLTMTRINSHGF